MEKAKTSGKEEKQGTIHTATASMDYPTNVGVDIQAKKQPNEFTIPKGSKGTKLKYQFYNPKSGHTLTKLHGSNIYSVTEKRYMHELDSNPDFELPAGQYRFVIGGDPGATGTLSYTTVLSKGEDTTTETYPPKETTKETSKDKPKTGAEPNPLHPGGEGKRKVTVDFGTGKLDAWLTTDGNKLTLNFDVPGFQSEYSVVKNICRWEGTLEKNAKGTTASGKTSYESCTSYKHGQVSRFKMEGTFTAILEGNVLAGSFKEQTVSVSDSVWGDKAVRPAPREGRWRIESFSP